MPSLKTASKYLAYEIISYVCCLDLSSVLPFDSPVSFSVSIESESAYPPQELFPVAIQELRSRIARLRRAAEALVKGEDEDTNADEALHENEQPMDTAW